MYRFRYWTAFSIGTLTSRAASYVNQNSCPLLGPAYPQPQRLTPSLIQPCTDNLTADVESALAGQNTSYGVFDNVTTSFSIALWSTTSNASLFEYHFEGTEIRGDGHDTLNNQTVYRIGSISKVFTVYAYLASIGEAHLDEPITHFVPELAEIDRERVANATSNDVDNVRWSDLTPRALAAQMGGVPRDCEPAQIQPVVRFLTCQMV
jgi:CubicO group peptidase (beta-lactamase class C family)